MLLQPPRPPLFPYPTLFRSQPHPPTWVAATSPEAISWAAAGGYSILMDPHATFSEIGAKYDRYVDELATHGHAAPLDTPMARDRKSTRLNSSHGYISYAVFC